jgi:pentapeptide repeat protein
MQSEPRSSPTAEPEGSQGSSRILRRVVVVSAALALVGLLVLILRKGHVNSPWWEGAHDKDFWAYLKLLLVPVAIAIGVAVLNQMQIERARKAEGAQQARDRVAQEASRQRELEVERQRAQDEALQAYIDQIGQLLLDKDRPLLKPATASEPRTETDGDEVRTLARARTLTVLPRLNGERKRSVLQFLYESHLVIKGHVVVALRRADLRGAELSATNLREAHLTDAYLHAAAPYQGPEHQARRCPGLRGPTRRRLRCGVAGLSVRALVASAAHGTHT